MSEYINKQQAIDLIESMIADRGHAFNPHKLAMAVKDLEGVEIVRCKDCKWFDVNRADFVEGYGYCEIYEVTNKDSHYCSYGERKEKHQLSGETSTISEETSTISEKESVEDDLFNKSFWRMGMHDSNVRPCTMADTSTNEGDAEGEESTMGQPKGKLYIPLNQHTVERINRLHKNDCGDYFDEEWLYNELEQIAEIRQPSQETSMNDCISRQQAIEALTGWETEPLDEDIVRTLNNLPPVTPTERTGKWIFRTDIPIRDGACSSGYVCSNCGKSFFRVDRYMQTDAENFEPTKIIAWRPKPNSVTADTIEAELMEEREIELGNLLFGNSRGTVPVPRGRWEERFHDFLYKNGFDMYGYIDKENLKQYEKVIYSEGESHHYFENDTFRIMPYWWGDSEEISQMPNFVYKPTGYEVQWYKWPLRDSYANREVSYKEFCEILDKSTTHG